MRRYFSLFLLACLSVHAQNTVAYEEGSMVAEANLSEIAWMEGHWKGEAFGGITEEIWGPPLGNSMVFSFKLVVDNTVEFYELGHIRQIGKTLVFELKHFGGDLKAWEEKDEVQRFKFVKIEDNRVYFDGFTFEKISDTEINIYALIEHADATKEEVKFNYKIQT